MAGNAAKTGTLVAAVVGVVTTLAVVPEVLQAQIETMMGSVAMCGGQISVPPWPMISVNAPLVFGYLALPVMAF
jgi:hypothetical protein